MARLLPLHWRFEGCVTVFKIPDALAPRLTVRDFEAGSALPVNASNIAIFSWGARNAAASRHHRLFPIAVVRQPTSLFLRAPVCTYVIEYALLICDTQARSFIKGKLMKIMFNILYMINTFHEL
ncbi:hypothetical protein ALC60_04045 [Trachymyrmex zeteki]|uniref:Uncharacterized protein n=1 Tax=Mycetomoellerius zeteki TaxID=64791 RepID=A0A151X9K6_9HYME|nr:hypothetical protein ALC60_04045 [Trachymyrmex zeteki]